MGVPQDIKRAYRDVGTSIEVHKADSVTSGEYIDVISNAQVTKWFVREYFKECSFPYDTSGEAGDIIRLVRQNESFLIMNIDPEILFDEVIEKSGVLYKCNVSGELQRPSGELSYQTYHEVDNFITVDTDVYGLYVERLYGHGIDVDEELGQLNIERHSLYIPARYGVQEMDRYYTDLSGENTSGEYYRVESVKRNHFPGVDVCELGEDLR